MPLQNFVPHLRLSILHQESCQNLSKQKCSIAICHLKDLVTGTTRAFSANTQYNIILNLKKTILSLKAALGEDKAHVLPIMYNIV